MLADSARLVVEALRSLGRIEDVDDGLCAAYVALADEIDQAGVNGKDRAGLFREFRAYDAAVRHLRGGEDDGTDIDRLLADLSSEMGDAAPARPPNEG